ncbi:MAG: hemerythrin domain-containing protein [Holophaga sp.]|jgi:regulator of cell morphogenesis and NO signaling
MPIDPLTPIDNLTAEHPQTRRLLCRLGVDVLTEGNLTLREAALRHGIPVQEVIRDLETLTRESAGRVAQDWLQATKSQLVEHIVQHHHVFTREELARFGPLLEGGLAADLPAHPELAQVAIHFRNLEKDLLTHFQMEEKNLFPALCATEKGGPIPISLSTPKEQLRTINAEHQAVEELFLNIRMITEDYTVPKDASPGLRALYLGLRDLEDDLHVHLYLENHLLYPRVLPGESW